MEAVLASLVAVIGTLAAAFGGLVIQAHTSRKGQLRTTAARFAHRLSVHRGHLYDRWEIAQKQNPDPAEVRAANDTSNASRSDITLALYELRVLTRNPGLLNLAEAAVAATYAVKPPGEDLSALTRADLEARRQRGLTADAALLAAAAAL
ncbi:hypothetical protein [Streptomyces fuscichromogenes]|uniref:Uncharacterized protein n=1 Tax=Streptomyces fuscichromogenes TaxID=1324013 RepID=A0A917XPC2_9ACTN|nr:hypothetical protein [Streptomyces fuscichromogenes]GGN46290.1 hypothetical protein GCM10011578_099060 [Streptomyces fuscichromogenes]